jgi:putative NIF3 family GTP cyclohydrolase 1 type 2
MRASSPVRDEPVAAGLDSARRPDACHNRRMISRRMLLQAWLGGVLAPAPFMRAHASAPMRALDAVDRIKASIGVPWRADTVDKIVAGDPATEVRGIAVTMMATLDVLRGAAAADCNLVVTHEPTFYDHFEKAEALANDDLVQAKHAFIDQHQLVVFRLHDHWHLRSPDGIGAGMQHALDWTGNALAGKPGEFSFPATPLRDFARTLAKTLGADSMRVLGDPALPVRRVATRWGYAGWGPELQVLAAREDIDLLIVGEAREWELVEYMQDRIDSGARHALILLGHVASEQAGMQACAEWLRTVFEPLPVQFLPAREPFWTVG